MHILKSTFRRNGETTVCELGLTYDDSAYELQIDAGRPADRVTEVFDDAMAAFQRHATIERWLVNEGWLLESFETQTVVRS